MEDLYAACWLHRGPSSALREPDLTGLNGTAQTAFAKWSIQVMVDSVALERPPAPETESRDGEPTMITSL